MAFLWRGMHQDLDGSCMWGNELDTTTSAVDASPVSCASTIYSRSQEDCSPDYCREVPVVNKPSLWEAHIMAVRLVSSAVLTLEVRLRYDAEAQVEELQDLRGKLAEDVGHCLLAAVPVSPPAPLQRKVEHHPPIAAPRAPQRVNSRGSLHSGSNAPKTRPGTKGFFASPPSAPEAQGARPRATAAGSPPTASTCASETHAPARPRGPATQDSASADAEANERRQAMQEWIASGRQNLTRSGSAGGLGSGGKPRRPSTGALGAATGPRQPAAGGTTRAAPASAVASGRNSRPGSAAGVRRRLDFDEQQ